jgi:glyoxylase-like metal-dependent hydrolase (beta-lactamase superfamily II)
MAGLAGSTGLPAAAVAAEAPAYRFVDAAPGVRAALMPTPRRFLDGNAVLLAVGDETMIVDGAGDARLAGQVVEEAKRLGRPVRWFVATHWHGDHTRAAAVYRQAFPGVELLGHRTLVEDVPGRDGARRWRRRRRDWPAVWTGKASRWTRQGAPTSRRAWGAVGTSSPSWRGWCRWRRRWRWGTAG